MPEQHRPAYRRPTIGENHGERFSTVPQRKILFVDDEPSLRTALPAVLEKHGYRVTTAATVREALKRMHGFEFDVLVTDLNIGEPGDGFTVASAMRRTHPNCLNIILTGYPASEAALNAIHRQVDHFLVKPTHPDVLVSAIEEKIHRIGTHRDRTPAHMADFLRQNGSEIIHRTLEGMEAHPQIGALPLNDAGRIDHLPAVFTRLAALLECADLRQKGAQELLRDAAQHGVVRKRQGYSADMLVDDRRLLGGAIHEVVQESLLDLNISRVIPDLQRISESLDLQLKAALVAYSQEPESAS